MHTNHSEFCVRFCITNLRSCLQLCNTRSCHSHIYMHVHTMDCQVQHWSYDSHTWFNFVAHVKLCLHSISCNSFEDERLGGWYQPSFQSFKNNENCNIARMPLLLVKQIPWLALRWLALHGTHWQLMIGTHWHSDDWHSPSSKLWGQSRCYNGCWRAAKSLASCRPLLFNIPRTVYIGRLLQCTPASKFTEVRDGVRCGLGVLKRFDPLFTATTLIFNGLNRCQSDIFLLLQCLVIFQDNLLLCIGNCNQR